MRKPIEWRELELQIQKSAHQKDDSLCLEGPWKKFVRVVDDFCVYRVSGDWVRVNLSAIFGYGGHGWVHEFIPLNEVWIGDCHWEGSGAVFKQKLVSNKFFESTIVHEVTEAKLMRDGMEYTEAHEIAEDAERTLGLLADPYQDDGD